MKDSYYTSDKRNNPELTKAFSVVISCPDTKRANAM